MVNIGTAVHNQLFSKGSMNMDMIGHGSARFALRDELVSAGLLDSKKLDTSIIVGGWRESSGKVKYLVHTGPESCLLFAPARSGKGVSHVVPILLSYSKSCLIHDVKGELWELTSQYRKAGLGNRVLSHDPSSYAQSNSRFNPIDEIRINEMEAVKDAQLIAHCLITTGGTAADNAKSRDHFKDSARSLLTGVILYECYLSKSSHNLPSIRMLLSKLTNPDQHISDYLSEMNDFKNTDCLFLDVIRETAAEMLSKPEREFGSVLSSLTTPLSIFRDPIIAKATSHSDFKISDLVSDETPVSLYLISRASDRSIHADYFQLLITLVCRRLTEHLPKEGERRHELLLMLDEFSSLPSIPVVQESMDVMPGYGIKAFIVLQDFNTLTRLYGENETISSNCKITIAYTPNNMKTAKLLSDMLGVSTIMEENISKQKKRMSVVNDSSSLSQGVHSRPLMTPDEIKLLKVPTVHMIDSKYQMTGIGELLIFSRGCRPIRGVQTPWFLDNNMAQRVMPLVDEEKHSA